MITMTIAEFHAALKAQGVKRHEDFAFRCVMCGTIQSGQSLINASAGKTFDEVEKFVGFSCVGRFTNAGPHKKGNPPGKGCDWTLGGLFTFHDLEVIDTEGKPSPRFALATPEEAQALAASWAAIVPIVPA